MLYVTIDACHAGESSRKGIETVRGTNEALTSQASTKYNPPRSSVRHYKVEKGDNLYSIANKHNSTPDSIKTLNKLTSNILSIGEILKESADAEGLCPKMIAPAIITNATTASLILFDIFIFLLIIILVYHTLVFFTRESLIFVVTHIASLLL